MTVQVPAARPRTPWIAIAPWAAIAALSCLVILAAQGMGLLSLLLAVLFGVAAALLIAAYAPAALVVLAPALLPPERLWIVFPWELAYLGLAAIVALHALYARPDWARRLERMRSRTCCSWAGRRSPSSGRPRRWTGCSGCVA